MAETPLQWHQALDAWQSEFERRLTNCVKDLLEQKHLYQSVAVDMGDTFEKLRARVDTIGDCSLTMKVLEIRRANWIVIDPAHPRAQAGPPIAVKIPDVKMFCERCARIEAYNLIAADNFLARGFPDNKVFGAPVVQVFAVSFLCQSCKTFPEVFLVRRVGEKLTLCGRAPMEVAEVPAVIPKSIARFYGGCVIAHQSGQTLAGLFMLRTVIEQWARSQVADPPDHADQLLDAYMATLPPSFNQQFPSMRSLYGDLSVDIHAAAGSDELFKKAVGEINEHFEARRLYKLAT